MALFYSQENYSPESFSTATNELPCLLRRKAGCKRRQRSQCPHTTWERSGVPGLSGGARPTAPRSRPPSGTTCLKKAGAGCGLARTTSGLTNAGQPALFSTRTPRHRISSLCRFSWDKRGGPRGRMTTNETLLPSWWAKQAAKGRKGPTSCTSFHMELNTSVCGFRVNVCGDHILKRHSHFHLYSPWSSLQNFLSHVPQWQKDDEIYPWAWGQRETVISNPLGS